MEVILTVFIVILAIVWASRVETGLNKLNATMERIEKHLVPKDEKKEKK